MIDDVIVSSACACYCITRLNREINVFLSLSVVCDTVLLAGILTGSHIVPFRVLDLTERFFGRSYGMRWYCKGTRDFLTYKKRSKDDLCFCMNGDDIYVKFILNKL